MRMSFIMVSFSIVLRSEFILENFFLKKFENCFSEVSNLLKYLKPILSNFYSISTLIFIVNFFFILINKVN